VRRIPSVLAAVLLAGTVLTGCATGGRKAAPQDYLVVDEARLGADMAEGLKVMKTTAIPIHAGKSYHHVEGKGPGSRLYEGSYRVLDGGLCELDLLLQEGEARPGELPRAIDTTMRTPPENPAMLGPYQWGEGEGAARSVYFFITISKDPGSKAEKVSYR
jgi:hypothetical protein